MQAWEVMKKGKDNGWEGAFGFICCIITLVWARTPTPLGDFQRSRAGGENKQRFGEPLLPLALHEVYTAVIALSS